MSKDVKTALNAIRIKIMKWKI